ncbi:hypothetical protein C8R44DRAFT_991952 [Mycena epipterygia]|nr:hypothetical protein C8R44DRAFT_991952 [Mycena epipterygia]
MISIFPPRWAVASQLIPDEVVVSDARLCNYFAASAYTILFIDFIFTIDDEINFVWTKPWRLPSVLYLWNRYMTLFVVTLCMSVMFREVKSDHVCKSFIITEGLASTLLFGSFNLLLVLRVWILYDKTRRMAYILFPFLLFEMISMVITLLLSDSTYLHEFIHLGPILPGCYFTTAPENFAFYALPPLMVTFTMFVLTAHKCVVTLREDKLADMPVITLFLRDGLIWFIVVFFFYGAQMIIWLTGRPTLMQVLVIPSLALFSLISSRILLNTKALASQSDIEEEEEEEFQRLLPPVSSRVGWRRV